MNNSQFTKLHIVIISHLLTTLYYCRNSFFLFEYRFNKVGLSKIRYLDFIKAFDKVPREILVKKLYKFGIRGKMFIVIRDMYTDNTAKVLINNRYTREF